MVRKLNQIELGPNVSIDNGCFVGYQPSRKIEDYNLKIGKNSIIRFGTVIYLGSRIGDNFETGHNVIVREQCQIGEDVKIWSSTIVDYGVTIGNNVKIHSLCYVSQKAVIENDCFLAPGVMLANEKYPTGYYEESRISGPIIRTGAKIGANVTILPGVEIGENATIGAGSVVTKNVESESIYYGNPARKKFQRM